MEEIDLNSLGSTTNLSSPRENPFHGNNGHPPRRGHSGSNINVPLGFSAMIESSLQLVPISGHGILSRRANVKESSGNDHLKSQEMDRVSYGNRCLEGIGERKPEGEVVDASMNLDNVDGADKEGVLRHHTGSRGRVRRSAVGDNAPQYRHYRSLSMDSCIGNFHFGDLSPKLQTSFCNRADQLSQSNTLRENVAKINFDFGHYEFSEVELKRIMADERLAEIAISDPKQAKRVLANRQSAARSKERKLHYISELERKVQALQTEATTLLAQITVLQIDHAELSNQNNELKFRIQAAEQQAKLRDALHETLTAEVQRLKLENMEFREEDRPSNGIVQQVPMKHHMFPMQQQQHNQIQRMSATTSKTLTKASAAPASL